MPSLRNLTEQVAAKHHKRKPAGRKLMVLWPSGPLPHDGAPVSVVPCVEPPDMGFGPWTCGSLARRPNRLKWVSQSHPLDPIAMVSYDPSLLESPRSCSISDTLRLTTMGRQPPIPDSLSWLCRAGHVSRGPQRIILSVFFLLWGDSRLFCRKKWARHVSRTTQQYELTKPAGTNTYERPYS